MGAFVTDRAVPLEGVKVLELAEGVAGPFAGKMMGAMGADVIKVEPPGRGDAARAFPPFLDDAPHPETSGLFLYLNTNKRGVTLDLAHPSGRELARRLVGWADVIVESSAPGRLAEWGLGYEAIAPLNPGAILVSVTPFGQDGPYRDYQSSDLVALALGGLLYITGEPDREPLKLGGQPSEYFAGLAAFSAAMVALHHRDAGGEGQHVDVSVLEGIATAQMYAGLNYAYLHENRRRQNAFAPMFRAKDGHVGVMYRQPNWPTFCEMIGHPELVRDERFRDVAARRDHAGELNAIVAEWMASQPKEELYHRAQAARMPFGYICDARDLIESPQYGARGYFQEIDHPLAGRHLYPGMPIHWGHERWELHGAPLLGAHNAEVYGGLGVSGEELAVLRACGAI